MTQDNAGWLEAATTSRACKQASRYAAMDAALASLSRMGRVGYRADHKLSRCHARKWPGSPAVWRRLGCPAGRHAVGASRRRCAVLVATSISAGIGALRARLCRFTNQSSRAHAQRCGAGGSERSGVGSQAAAGRVWRVPLNTLLLWAVVALAPAQCACWHALRLGHFPGSALQLSRHELRGLSFVVAVSSAALVWIASSSIALLLTLQVAAVSTAGLIYVPLVAHRPRWAGLASLGGICVALVLLTVAWYSDWMS